MNSTIVSATRSGAVISASWPSLQHGDSCVGHGIHHRLCFVRQRVWIRITDQKECRHGDSTRRLGIPGQFDECLEFSQPGVGCLDPTLPRWLGFDVFELFFVRSDEFTEDEFQQATTVTSLE